jgi:hypothetical protein
LQCGGVSRNVGRLRGVIEGALRPKAMAQYRAPSPGCVPTPLPEACSTREASALDHSLRRLVDVGDEGWCDAQHKAPGRCEEAGFGLHRPWSAALAQPSKNFVLAWPFPSNAVTWLILPVVICLSQRLSHACLSINCFILRNCEWLIKSVIVYLMVLTTRITVVILELIRAHIPTSGRDVFIR